MTETGPRQTIRAIVASFLFTDLVGFSKGTAAEQYAAKTSLSEILHRNLAPLSESDYWIKDTGDGALIAFVSNPEHALYTALALDRDYQHAARAAGIPSNTLRTGLHLGTVKEVIDLESRRNFIGDGINAAKRIMDFAGPGQIAASRAFFDAIANLDAAYAGLFQHLGASDDKHGRAHELYAITPSDAVLDKLKSELAAEREQAPDPAGQSSPPAAPPRNDSARTSARLFRPAPIVIAMAATLGIASLLFVVRERGAAVPMQPAKSEPVTAQAPARSETAPLPSPGESVTLPKSVGTAGASTVSDIGAPVSRNTGAPASPAGNPSSNASKDGGVPGAAVDAAATPATHAAEHRADMTPTTASPVPPPTRASGSRAKVSASSETDASQPRASPRCSRIVEKAAVGEPLTQEEKKDLANSCR